MKNSFPLTFALVPVLFFAVRTQAQEISGAQPGNFILHVADVGLGNWNGIKIGGDYVLSAKTGERTKRGKLPQTFVRNTHLTFNFSVIHRNASAAGSILTVGYQLQKTRTGGWFTTLEPMLGLRSSFGATTDNNSLFSINSNRRFVSGVSFGFGRNFLNTKLALPLSVYSKFAIYNTVPRFRILRTTSMVEIGVSYNMGSIFKRTNK
jgi:hypothetical protein